MGRDFSALPCKGPVEQGWALLSSVTKLFWSRWLSRLQVTMATASRVNLGRTKDKIFLSLDFFP